MIMKEDTIVDGGSRSNKSSETHFSETVKHMASREDVETTSCYWSDLSLSSHNSCIIIWPFLHFIAVCELRAAGCSFGFDKTPSDTSLATSAFSIVNNVVDAFLLRLESTVSWCA